MMRDREKGKHRAVLLEECHVTVNVTYKAVGKANALRIYIWGAYETDILHSVYTRAFIWGAYETDILHSVYTRAFIWGAYEADILHSVYTREFPKSTFDLLGNLLAPEFYI